jgi:segregation and condensation protein B
MSLKSKIEAVIYAAEEPVTLAQLATLFGDEALAERAERQRVEAAIAAEAALAARNQAVLMVEGEGMTPVAMEAEAAEDSDGATSEPEAPAASEPIPIASRADAEGSNAPDDAVAEPGSEVSSAEAGGDVSGDAAMEEKRAARAREREIREEIRGVVAGLIADYARGDRGMEIREVAGGYRVATKPEYHDAVRAFVKSLKPPMKLSLQALETLAVIAYKQPVTAPEVSEIRGVDSAGVLGSLISRKLVTTAGRKQVIGRPILYKTTKEFLLRFGLKDVAELPSMEEFEKMAGELNDESPAQELPFGVAPDGEPSDNGASEAVEANAGEAGVAVSAPAEVGTDDSVVEEASPAVALDAHAPAAEEVSPEDTEGVEVAAADHAAGAIAGDGAEAADEASQADEAEPAEAPAEPAEPAAEAPAGEHS